MIDMNVPNLEALLENRQHFFLMAGPCVVEGREITFRTAEALCTLCERLKVPLIFKSSYRKANRSRLDSFTGIGDEEALRILSDVRDQFALPIVTDIHEAHEAEIVAEIADVLQIPAFLSRQTELLIAAGKTGKHVNIKKGQFMAPDAIRFAADKIRDTGNHRIILTDRGTMFGYDDLIVDFRSIPRMRRLGYPVVMDVTHSLQRPNTATGVTGGHPEEISTIASAAIATEVDGVFIETHPNPSQALSDGANMLPLNQLESLLQRLLRIEAAIQLR